MRRWCSRPARHAHAPAHQRSPQTVVEVAGKPLIDHALDG